MKRTAKRSLICLLPLTLALVACNRPAPPQEKLTITGSSTIAPLLVEIAQRYELQHPQLKIDVQSGGSARGIADTRQGNAHIGMVSRSPQADEQDLHWYGLARDGVGIIVNTANPVVSLSTRQIVDIYTGKLTDWAAITGKSAAISVVNKAEGRSTLEVFLRFFALRNSDIHAHVIIGDNQQGIKTVAGNAGAIGYVSIGSAEVAIKDGAAIKLLPVNGIDATIGNVANGSFPIARTLHLITTDTVDEQAQRFISYCLSASVHDLIESQYFVPVVH